MVAVRISHSECAALKERSLRIDRRQVLLAGAHPERIEALRIAHRKPGMNQRPGRPLAEHDAPTGTARDPTAVRPTSGAQVHRVGIEARHTLRIGAAEMKMVEIRARF